MPVEIHRPTIVTDGGPWAEHDQACAVCHERKATLDLSAGVFLPCGPCRGDGWEIRQRRRRLRRR